MVRLEKLCYFIDNPDQLKNEVRPFVKDIKDETLSITMVILVDDRSSSNIWQLGSHKMLAECSSLVNLRIKKMLRCSIVAKKCSINPNEALSVKSPITIVKTCELIKDTDRIGRLYDHQNDSLKELKRKLEDLRDKYKASKNNTQLKPKRKSPAFKTNAPAKTKPKEANLEPDEKEAIEFSSCMPNL